MKGKVKREIRFTDGKSISQGTELEITMVSCGAKGERYRCVTPFGEQVILDDVDLNITDYSPCVDWEQRYYEIVRSAVQGLCSNIGPDVSSNICMESVVNASIGIADAIIKKLRNKNL